MIDFQCGLNCGCSDTECSGNPDPKLAREFERAKLLDVNFLRDRAISLHFIRESSWDKDTIAEIVGKLDNRKGASLNIALTGKASNSVPLFDCMEILGKKEVIDRLMNPTRLLYFR
jgi:hypothetical protein